MLLWATRVIYKLVYGKKTKIFPRIKHVDFIKAFNDIPETNSQNSPLTESLVENVVLAYGIDHGDHTEMLSKASLSEMKLSIVSMREFAYVNMQFKLQDFKLEENGKVTRLFIDGGLSSCVLLMSTFWNEFESKLHIKVAVAIPHRDYLFFADSSDSESMQQLKDIVNECVLPDRHNLTKCIFVRKSKTEADPSRHGFNTFPHGMTDWQKVE